MWTPVILSIIVIFASAIVLAILEKKEIIKQSSRLYRLIEVLGLYIPIIVICGYTGYMKTDTLNESIIVLSGIFICIILLGMFYKVGSTQKLNYVYFPIVILSCYFILNYITPYMLSGFESGLFAAVVGSFLGSFITNNKNKGKLIISAIIVSLMVITTPISYLRNFENNSKVENVAAAYLNDLGYSYDSGRLAIMNRATRHEPIHLFTTVTNPDIEPKLTKYIRMIYFDGEIIEFKVD